MREIGVPKEQALFTINPAIEDIGGFRREMKLGKVHMLGSSYGGLLAIGYALKFQRNLKSLITTGGIDDVQRTIEEMLRMKSKLTQDVL